MTNPEETMAMAAKHHQEGRLPEARALYLKVLEQRPDHAPALCALGTLALQTGRADEALERLGRAAELQPDDARVLHGLGLAHLGARNPDQAETCFQRALTLDPDSAEACSSLAGLYCQQGKIDQARELYVRAVDRLPEHAPAHYNLGNAHVLAGELEQGAACYQRAVDLDPEYGRAWNNLGGVRRRLGQFDQAREALERAMLLDPMNPVMGANLASVLLRLGDFDQAGRLLEQAAGLLPQNAQVQNSLGMARFGQGRLSEAVLAFMQALTIQDNYPQALGNLANALREEGKFDAALEAYNGALRNDPAHAPARRGRGRLRLLMGDYLAGWTDWRLGLTHPRRLLGPDLAPWDGAPLAGRGVLLWADGGPDEALLFLRLLPLAAERDCRIYLAPPPELAGLAARIPQAAAVFEHDAAPPADCATAMPLAGLGAILNPAPEDIPREPFLSPDPALAEKWRDRLPPGPEKLAGLAWRDDSGRLEAVHRSIPPGALAPLAQAPGVRWVPLHPGDAPEGLAVCDLEPPSDPENLLALMACLDLIVTVEGRQAALASAAGLPLWALLAPAPDWSWGLGEQTPWHPRARLFRSRENQNWDAAVQELGQALTDWAQNGGGPAA